MLILYTAILILLYITSSRLKMKKDRLIPILACGLLIILMGGQTNNPDYLIYRTIFNGDFYSKDPGFGLIIWGLKYIGFNETNFRLGIAIIGYILISFTVYKYLKDRRLFYLFYAIYPFMFDVVQARNFLVMAILTYSVPLLINPTLRKKIIFVITILCAFTIQKVAILYLPLVFIDSITDNKYNKFFFRIILFLSVAVALNKSTLIRVINLLVMPITGGIKELSSYVGINTSYGWIVFWLEQIVVYILVMYANKIIKQDYNFFNNTISNADYEEKMQFSQLILKINYYMFVFLPLFILDENYTRIIRNVLPLNIIVFVIALTRNSEKIKFSKKRTALLIGILFYLLILFYLMFRSYASSIVYPTLNENWIF